MKQSKKEFNCIVDEQWHIHDGIGNELEEVQQGKTECVRWSCSGSKKRRKLRSKNIAI